MLYFANEEWEDVEFYPEDLQVICNKTVTTTLSYFDYNFYREEKIEETYNFHSKESFDTARDKFNKENK